MSVVYLAIGSNVGDSRAHIEKAVQLLAKSIYKIVQAPMYTSKAVGYTEQANFLNTAIKGQTHLKPKELLDFVKATEKLIGRIERFAWGPREIDIDIIFYDDEIVEELELQIPHARFAERDFVLIPLKDLEPTIVDPQSGKTVSELYEQLPKDSLSVVRKG